MLREKRFIIENMHRTLDMSLVATSFILSYFIKKFCLPSYSGLSTEPNYYFILLSSLFICFIVFNALSLYSPRPTTKLSTLVFTNLQAVVISNLLLIVLLYILHVPPISRLFFLLNALILSFLLVASKLIIHTSLKLHRSSAYNTRHILLVGTGAMAHQLIRAVDQSPESSYKIIGCLEPQEEHVQFRYISGCKVEVIGSIAHYQSILYDHTVDELVFALHNLTKIPDIVHIFRFSEDLGINVRIMPDFQIDRIMYSPETARMEIKPFLGLPAISISSTPPNEVEIFLKTCLDYTLAALLTFLLSPLFIVVGALIKITSPGPIFFSQERCGLFGRRFKILKFRTMYHDTEKLQQKLHQENEMDGPVFKILADPRITPLGRILRKSSLDELPQLFNVLMGQMSLVGPRPPLPSEVEEYEPWQRRRLSMKPGLTCIWQVSGRNNIDFNTWMKLDLAYIDNWSLFLDCKLLLLTIKEILSFNGR